MKYYENWGVGGGGEVVTKNTCYQLVLQDKTPFKQKKKDEILWPEFRGRDP